MNLVDSCGWLEYSANGPNAAFFDPAIQDVASLLVPTICILEVFRCALRQGNKPDALMMVAGMRRAHVVALDLETALSAAQISIDLRLPLADSVILATARAHQAVLWTQDAHFQDIPAVRYVERK